MRVRGTRRRRLRVLLPVLALLTCLLAACGDDLPPPTWSTSPYGDVAQRMQATLDQRAKALRRGNVARFRSTLDRSVSGLVVDQQVYFDNIADLPVQGLRYEVRQDTITRVEGTDEYWAELVVSLRLAGYDTAPVRTRDRFLFRPADDGTALLIASTTDHRWEAEHPADVQPWDIDRVHVVQRANVLGIFDGYTAEHSGPVMDAVAEGRSDVQVFVGSQGSVATGVVVYSLRDSAFLRGLASTTVGDPDRADGLTIGVPADALEPGRGVASYRIFLNPRVLDEPAEVLGRLVRHELTHAALGSRGHGAPLWLTEGVAEYVSVRPMTPQQRRLPARALDVATTATDLPGPEQFGSDDAEAWYAISWWVCEYIASAYGDDVLFLLLDRLEDGGDQGAVISSVLGVTTEQLTQRGIALMQTTYS